MALTCLSARSDSVRQSTGWRRFFCAMTLVAAFYFCPSRADASCGDYVVVLNPSAEYLRNTDMEHASRPMAPACPCHGPQCRTGDPSPPMPVPAQITPELGAIISDAGTGVEACLSGYSNLVDSSSDSQPHLLAPDPPPRSLS